VLSVASTDQPAGFRLHRCTQPEDCQSSYVYFYLYLYTMRRTCCIVLPLLSYATDRVYHTQSAVGRGINLTEYIADC
jgi:hypothetical protein